MCRHLEADVEFTCLPDESLEDLEATFSKDDKKYKNIYLVTILPCDLNDVQFLMAQYREIIHATRVIVSSILSALEDKEVNVKIDLMNKSLNHLCQETGCEFVDNNGTFKYGDGAVIEGCFDEDGGILSEFGIKDC